MYARIASRVRERDPAVDVAPLDAVEVRVERLLAVLAAERQLGMPRPDEFAQLGR